MNVINARAIEKQGKDHVVVGKGFVSIQLESPFRISMKRKQTDAPPPRATRRSTRLKEEQSVFKPTGSLDLPSVAIPVIIEIIIHLDLKSLIRFYQCSKFTLRLVDEHFWKKAYQEKRILLDKEITREKEHRIVDPLWIPRTSAWLHFFHEKHSWKDKYLQLMFLCCMECEAYCTLVFFNRRLCEDCRTKNKEKYRLIHAPDAKAKYKMDLSPFVIRLERGGSTRKLHMYWERQLLLFKEKKILPRFPFPLHFNEDGQ